MPVITFTSEKGGVGKTSTSANIAAAFAEAGDTVLAVDLDPQGNLTQLFGVPRDPDIVGVAELLDPVDPSSPAESIRTAVRPRIDLMPSVKSKLKATERALQAEVVGRETFLRSSLEPLNAVYDWIVIDTPPNTGLLVVNALVASEGVIAVSLFERWAIEGAAEIQGLVSKCNRVTTTDTEFWGVMFNLVQEKTVLTRLVGEDVAATDTPFLRSQISRRTSIAQANYADSTVIEFSPTSESAAEYRKAAREIAVRAGRAATAQRIAALISDDQNTVDLTDRSGVIR